MACGYRCAERSYPYLNAAFYDGLIAKYNGNVTYRKKSLLNMKLETKADSHRGLHCTGCELQGCLRVLRLY